MEERLIKVGITHGDINGIGYEVILKHSRMPELPNFVLRLYTDHQNRSLSPESVGIASCEYEHHFPGRRCRY